MPIWQMSLAYLICGFTTSILSVHFVPYAIGRGVSPSTAATIFGLTMGLNVVGSVGAGMLSDHFSRKNLLALVYFLRGIAYLVLLLVSSQLGLWAFALVAGFSWIATAPLTTALTADVYGLRALGTISGISLLFHSIGGFCSVYLAGWLYDMTGSYTIPFAIAGSLLFPAALFAFTIKERKYSARYQSQPVMATSAGDG
jgi:MFS family permease